MCRGNGSCSFGGGLLGGLLGSEEGSGGFLLVHDVGYRWYKWVHVVEGRNGCASLPG